LRTPDLRRRQTFPNVAGRIFFTFLRVTEFCDILLLLVCLLLQGSGFEILVLGDSCAECASADFIFIYICIDVCLSLQLVTALERVRNLGKIIRLHYVQQVLVQILPSEIHQQTSPKKNFPTDVMNEQTEHPIASGLLSRVFQVRLKNAANNSDENHFPFLRT
jgi:hypothetical protein